MTVKEAAKQLEVSARAVYSLCAAGLIGHMRIGVGRGSIRLEQADVDEYKRKAREGTVKPAPPSPYVLKHVRPQGEC